MQAETLDALDFDLLREHLAGRAQSPLGRARALELAPSTDVASTPPLTIIASNGEPIRIDWPTMTWFQATGLPAASMPASTRCT